MEALVPVRIEVAVLRKKIAMQIPKRGDLQRDNYEIVGWMSAWEISWQNGTGIAVLVHDHSRQDYAWMPGHSRNGKIMTRYEEEVTRHIYIS